MRWLISMGLVLLSVSPAVADIIVLDPTKTPPKPPGAIGQSLKDASGKVIKVAIRGRIVHYAPAGTAPASFFINVEIAKKVGNAVVYHTPAVRIDWINIRGLIHEIDHPLDLQFVLGNIDERLISWKSLNQSKVGLGLPVSNLYVKHAMGLLTDAELTVQLQQMRRGPPTVSWVPTQKIPNDPAVPVREGWLVRAIRDGPITDQTVRSQAIVKALMTDGVLFHPLTLEPVTADPIVGLDIKNTVHLLLKAAARDAFHGRMPRMRRGGIGVFMGVARRGRGQVIAKFGTLCLGVVRMLCGLTQYTGNTPAQRRAFAIGVQARQALIEALGSAARESLTLDDQAEEDRRVAAGPAAHRAAVAARKQELEREALAVNKTRDTINPDDPTYLPVDPSLIAIAALKTIQANTHWRIPVGDDDLTTDPEKPTDPALKEEAALLMKTLVELAQRPPAGDPRAKDYGRQPVMSGSAVQTHQDLGVRTRLRDEIEETLCGAAGILTPDPITRVDTGKHYRPYLTPLLANLDKGFDSSFLEYCLVQAGFGSEAELNKVVRRLFSIALADNKRDQLPLAVDRMEARDRRARAIAVLGRIAALGEAQITTGAGQPARAPTPAEVAAAEKVKQRLTGLLAARDAGRANHSSKRFFDTIEAMATAQGTRLNAYDRTALQRRYAQEIVRSYGRWVTGGRAQRMRELDRQIEGADEVLERDQRRAWQAERDRLEKAAREYRRRFGGQNNNNQSGN